MVMTVKVTGQHDVEQAARRLRTRANKREIRKRMQRALKEIAEPAANDVREAARNLPAKSDRHQLRSRIADAVYVDSKMVAEANVEIRISRAKMGAQAALPQLMDRGPFYHPLFGLPMRIVQEGHPNWFENAAKKKAPEAQTRFHEMVEHLAHDLSHD